MSTPRRVVFIVPALLLAAVVQVGALDGIEGSAQGWLSEADFWIATGANAAGIALFLARVHAPASAPSFGIVTQLIGIPAVVSGIADLAAGQADAATIGMFAYGGWAAAAAIVDHVLSIEYRDPRRPEIGDSSPKCGI